MDPEGFTSGLFRWNPARAMVQQPPPPVPPPPQQQPPATPQTAAFGMRLGGLEGLFGPYGVRFYTAAKIAELGFTASTLVGMKDEELEDMMNSLSHIFRWELLVGERYGVKAAVRAERRRLLEEEEEESSRRRHLLLSAAGDSGTHHALDALSQEDDWTGLSEEPVHQLEHTDAAGNNGGGGGYWDSGQAKMKKPQQRRRKKQMVTSVETDDDMNEGEDDDDGNGGGGGGVLGIERQREHPFIVTEPGEVARGKKNGLDYLFHLYEQCREFLIQVQTIAKDRGEKCPTKVTNQVFRYAKKSGASYINKPKMRHYVHCYALHCLDEEASNALRRAFKERGENVGSWRQACYKPLVNIACRHGWDIDAVFNAHPRLSIWYVPTKLRQLCHLERSNAVAAASALVGNGISCTGSSASGGLGFN
ncbi:PREDICTED: protein LEAFY-like [Brassica oleracea var. oleracea]|uniref:Floricaula/leafy-like transcription factor n=1 Tax=Brassica oleracea var. oleracea TaxID=109376 RepID=A0A0D3AY86_BRAOL|nr:PREDICTED: protein LEAFY-like [Brassica oleracea var. oleracea]